MRCVLCVVYYLLFVVVRCCLLRYVVCCCLNRIDVLLCVICWCSLVIVELSVVNCSCGWFLFVVRCRVLFLWFIDCCCVLGVVAWRSWNVVVLCFMVVPS